MKKLRQILLWQEFSFLPTSYPLVSISVDLFSHMFLIEGVGEYCKSAESRWRGLFKHSVGYLERNAYSSKKWWFRDLHIEYYIFVWYMSIEIGCQCKHLTETRAVCGKKYILLTIMMREIKFHWLSVYTWFNPKTSELHSE